jgi:hypothetical protein
VFLVKICGGLSQKSQLRNLKAERPFSRGVFDVVASFPFVVPLSCVFTDVAWTAENAVTMNNPQIPMQSTSLIFL